MGNNSQECRDKHCINKQLDNTQALFSLLKLYALPTLDKLQHLLKRAVFSLLPCLLAQMISMFWE
jgi:hypothetical protein